MEEKQQLSALITYVVAIRPQQGNFLFLIQEKINSMHAGLQLQNTVTESSLSIVPDLQLVCYVCDCVSSARKQEDYSLENVSFVRKTYFRVILVFSSFSSTPRSLCVFFQVQKEKVNVKILIQKFILCFKCFF